MTLLTRGNTAKLYALMWIADYIAQAEQSVRILDLGCGQGLHFAELLKRYPQTHYVGVEPSPRACAQARKNLAGSHAEIVQAHAYDVDRYIATRFDIIVSFSVLEHVYRRHDYLRCARRCLKDTGHFVINYDAGHFLSGKEWLSNTFGPLLARCGIERYYQSFVPEEQFRHLAREAGLAIEDAKVFNTSLKSIYKLIPDPHKDAYMHDWLNFELQVNERGLHYDDSQARWFTTRSFILAPA